jgi:membrane protein YqaA with SNARE-associated domain
MAEHPKAVWALSLVSFAESSFFPLPPDIMLIPMVLARRSKAFVYASFATLSSVLGGILGYAIGYFLFETVGKPVLDFYGYGDKFGTFAAQYNEWGAWIVLMAGLTPFPYKVITIASGVTGLAFPIFMIASIVARSIRFFAVSALLYLFGPQIRLFIEKYFGLVTIVFFVMLVGGFALVKLLF